MNSIKTIEDVKAPTDIKTKWDMWRARMTQIFNGYKTIDVRVENTHYAIGSSVDDYDFWHCQHANTMWETVEDYDHYRYGVTGIPSVIKLYDVETCLDCYATSTEEGWIDGELIESKGTL